MFQERGDQSLPEKTETWAKKMFQAESGIFTLTQEIDKGQHSLESNAYERDDGDMK